MVTKRKATEKASSSSTPAAKKDDEATKKQKTTQKQEATKEGSGGKRVVVETEKSLKQKENDKVAPTVVAQFLQSGLVQLGESPRDFTAATSFHFCLFRVFTRALDYYKTKVMSDPFEPKITVNHIKKGFKLAKVQFNCSTSTPLIREVMGVVVRSHIMFGVDIDYCKLTGKPDAKQALAALLVSDTEEAEYGWPRLPDGGDNSIPETYCEGLDISQYTSVYVAEGERQSTLKIPVFPLRPIEDEQGRVVWEPDKDTKAIPNSEYDGRALPLLPIIREKLADATNETDGVDGADEGSAHESELKPLDIEEVQDCAVFIRERMKSLNRVHREKNSGERKPRAKHKVEGDGRLWWRHSTMAYGLASTWEFDDRRAPIFYSSLERLIVNKSACACANLLSCSNHCALVYALYIASEAVAFLRSFLQLTWASDIALPPKEENKITAAFLCTCAIPVCKQLGFNNRVVAKAAQRIMNGLEKDETDASRNEANVFRSMKTEASEEHFVEEVKKFTKVKGNELLSTVFNREMRTETQFGRMRDFFANMQQLTQLYELKATRNTGNPIAAAQGPNMTAEAAPTTDKPGEPTHNADKLVGAAQDADHSKEATQDASQTIAEDAGEGADNRTEAAAGVDS